MLSPHCPMPTRRLRGRVLALILGLGAAPAPAATPKDTLVIADKLDSSITMDPAEVFEGTSAEVMGNIYDRLVRFREKDPSKPVADLAKSWARLPGRQDLHLRTQAGDQVRLGQPGHRRGRGLVAAARGALDKSPAFILTQFGFTKDNVAQMIKPTGPLTLTITTDKNYAPSFVLNCLTANVACVVDKKLLLTKRGQGRPGLRLAQEQLRRLRPIEAARVAGQRSDHAGAQRRLLGQKAIWPG